MRCNSNLAKTHFGNVLEYFRSLQKNKRVGKVKRNEKLEVKGKIIRLG